jgi:hypothetical protein
MDEPPSYDAVVKASQVLADIAPLLRPAVHTRRRQCKSLRMFAGAVHAQR